MQTNHESLIAAAKEAARDILRNKKVQALLGYIITQKTKLKDAKAGKDACTERFENDIKDLEEMKSVQEYDIRMAEETNNPLQETITKNAKKRIESIEESVKTVTARNAEDLASHDKNIESVTEATNEKIEEYKEKIENWHTGKSKVCRETMRTMASAMCEERIKDGFLAGEYDEDEAGDGEAQA